MPRPKTRTIKLPERITLNFDQETRTVQIGLASKNGDGQRVVTLNEPNMVDFGKLQAKAAALDEKMPKIEPFEDPKNPTGEELRERRDRIAEQNDYVYGEGMPYGNFFLEVIGACSDEEVKPEELGSWALSLDASRQVLDFFKNPSGGADVAALLARASTLQPEA